jgi:hypothetical protein
MGNIKMQNAGLAGRAGRVVLQVVQVVQVFCPNYFMNDWQEFENLKI